MRLVRSKSQSSSTPQSPNLLTGLTDWRKRHDINTAPSSPRAISTTTDDARCLPNLSRSLSEHSTRLRQSHYVTATNEENRPSLPTTSMFAETNATAFGTTDADTITTCANMDTNNTTRIRLLPNVELGSKCFVFDIIDRILTPTTLLKIGRYSERRFMPDRISFKSKVVSRMHAELWMEKGNKIFIRDIGSSSGTFINRIRLSKSNEVSQAMQLREGDIIQLGVDYQDNYQDDAMDQMYRAVKIRLEINKDSNKTNTFSRQAFQQFRQHFLGISYSKPLAYTLDTNVECEQFGANDRSNSNNDRTVRIHGQRKNENRHLLEHNIANHDSNESSSMYMQECCICLHAIAPLQALFIAPCSHGYHFKCLRPIIWQHYPGFSCPLCRNYYDLEASDANEVNQITDEMGSSTMKTISTTSTSIGVGPSPTLAASSAIHHYPSSPSMSSTQQYNPGQESGTNYGSERQRPQADRQGLFTENLDSQLLSTAAIEPSTMDQYGVY